MHPNWPIFWPADWRDPATLDLVQGTPLGYLLMPDGSAYEKVKERARLMNLAVCDTKSLPASVQMVKGEWPGIRMNPGQADASAGPTGAPWIDSNGWLVRLTRAGHAGGDIWVTAGALKSNEVVPLSRHLVAIADTATYGGRWVLQLDPELAGGLAAGKPAALDGWKKLMGSMAFFDAHEDWGAWPVEAVLSVFSSFEGANQFFSHELLNLMARTNISYGIVGTGSFQQDKLRGLRAALYPDNGPPPAAQRRAFLEFVESGGLLITGPAFGTVPGTPVTEEIVPRYQVRRFGKGRIAMARKQPEDPYEVAQDAQILLSHRYDLVRFFNGFLLSAYVTTSPDGKRRMTHIVNYGGGADDDDPATARIAGRFRSAKMWSIASTAAKPLEIAPQKDGIEVRLPGLAVYGGIELEA